MDNGKGMKYALTAAVTLVVGLLLIVVFLLLKLSHGEYYCQFHGTFNETVVAVPESAVTDDLNGDEPDATPRVRKHKKVLPPPSTPTSGVPIDSPPPSPAVTPVK